METMGMSLQLKARDTGRPIPFKKPKWIDFELNEADFGPYRPVNEHFFLIRVVFGGWNGVENLILFTIPS